jgi:hypothetical protein
MVSVWVFTKNCCSVRKVLQGAGSDFFQSRLRYAGVARPVASCFSASHSTHPIFALTGKVISMPLNSAENVYSATDENSVRYTSPLFLTQNRNCKLLLHAALLHCYWVVYILNASSIFILYSLWIDLCLIFPVTKPTGTC